MKHFSRRHFLTTTSAALIATSHSAMADRTLPELTIDDPIAQALGYQADAEAVDTGRFPKRAGASGATQFCSNCSLYKPVTDDLGTCTAIRGKLVRGPGWCNAWVPVS